MMPDKSLSEIITGIKDCLMAAFGPHLSTVPPTEDGWTLAHYLEALAQHFVPAIEMLLEPPAVSVHERIVDIREDMKILAQTIARQNETIADLKEQLGQVAAEDPQHGPSDPFWKSLLFGSKRSDH